MFWRNRIHNWGATSIPLAAIFGVVSMWDEMKEPNILKLCETMSTKRVWDVFETVLVEKNAMMPQVQLRSFCSEEVWHPRWEVLRKFLSMAQVVECQGLPKQNDLRWAFQSRYWILFSLAHFLSRSLLWIFLIPVINLFRHNDDSHRSQWTRARGTHSWRDWGEDCAGTILPFGMASWWGICVEFWSEYRPQRVLSIHSLIANFSAATSIPLLDPWHLW